MIILENKLEYLADALIPESFRQNAPQFYELIKAFLINIQNVQDSINNNFLDTIDLTKIKNDEIKKIYINTFLAMMNLEDEQEIDGLVDLVRVNKELSELKGTALLYTLLSKLLVYVLPNIGTQYNTLYAEYLEATGAAKVTLELQLEALRQANLDSGNMDISNLYDEFGDVVPFNYSIITDFDTTSFYKYIYEFAHPSGWLLDFSNAIYQLINETIEKYEHITIFDSVDYSATELADPILGADIDLATISNNIVNTDRLYIDGVYVKYRYHDWIGEVILGTTTKYNINAEQRTPPDIGMTYDAGGYLADTTGIASANGALDAGTGMITYQSFVNDLIP